MTLPVYQLASFALAATLACAVTPPLARAAWRYGFIARPHGHVTHRHPTPLLGGVALLTGFLPVLVWAGTIDHRWYWPLPALALIIGLGAYKDKVGRPVAVGHQLAVQLAAILIVVVGGAHHGWPGPAAFDVAALALLGLWLINGVNFLDVADGLAAGSCTICAAGFSVLAYSLGDQATGLTALGLAGACVGFLLYNLPPARLFMGDIGSFSLGLILFTLASACSVGGVHTLGSLLLLTLPLGEVVFTSADRLARRSSPFHDDGRHIGTILLARGWSPRVMLASTYGAGALIMVCALSVGLQGQ